MWYTMHPVNSAASFKTTEVIGAKGNTTIFKTIFREINTELPTHVYYTEENMI